MSKPKPMPSQKTLCELLRYEPETGKLFWRVRKNGNCFGWNDRFAHREAFKSTNNLGYYIGYIFRQKYFAHRIIFKMVHGVEPDRVDHINGKCDDNHIQNLRSVSTSENNRNHKRMITNTSGVTGVRWRQDKGKWQAVIGVRGVKKSIGAFDDIESAVAARKEAEKKYGYHKNHGRAV